MAGTALTSPYTLTRPDLQFYDEYLINSGDIINEGDLVGFVVVSGVAYLTPALKTSGSVVPAVGVAFFPGNNSTITYRTGDGTTMKAAITRETTLSNVNSTLVPAFAPGKRVYLGAIGSSTQSNYTCTQTTTNGDELQFVGWTTNNSTIEIQISTPGFQYQTAGNSTVNYA